MVPPNNPNKKKKRNNGFEVSTIKNVTLTKIKPYNCHRAFQSLKQK
jgi:hypothetical protein